MNENQCCECNFCSECMCDDYSKGKLAYCLLKGCLVEFYGNACENFEK